MTNYTTLNKKLCLAALSHDVYNSLTGINLSLNQVIDGWYGNNLSEIKPLLRAIRETTDRVTQLIESQRNNQSQLSINPELINEFSMLYLLQQIYLESLPKAKERSLTVHYEASPAYLHGTLVVGNAIDLGRMLGNLMQNAIKYTQSGDIFLRLFNIGDDLAIEIEDTGIGIEKEQIPNIFLPLWRSPDSSGSGLGLYVVMMVALAHGLKLTVESVVGRGTKFTIIFPYQNESHYGLTDTMLSKPQRLEDALST